jgi:hypothetical protein
VIVIEGAVRQRWRTAWEHVAREGSGGECTPAAALRQRDSLVFTVSAQTVADRRWSYRLALQPKKSVDQSLNITVNAAGLLSGINYEVADRTGDIVTNVLKGIGGVAGSFVGLGTASRESPPGVSRGDTAYAPSDVDCLLRSSAGAPFRKLADLEAEVDALLDARRRNAALMMRTTGAAQAAGLKERDNLLAHSVAVVADQASRLRERMVAAAATNARTAGVGERLSEPIPFFQAFDLAEVPPIADPEVEMSVARSDPRWPLLEIAGLIVAVSELPPGGGASPDGVTSVESLGCQGTSGAGECAQLHYRVPKPRIVHVFRTNALENGPWLGLVHGSITPLAASSDPIHHVSVSAKRFSTSGFQATFGSHGNLIGVKHQSTSSLTNGSGAMVNAIAAGRSEFLAGLKAAADAQSSILGITQSARAARIRELQDEKLVLDAGVALQGAKGSQEFVLAKLKLDAELAMLSSQQALEANPASAFMSGLQTEVTTIKLQLELLKAMLELESARKAATAAPPVGTP